MIRALILAFPSLLLALDGPEILAKRCHACHASTQSGGLRLDSREGALQGGKSGPALKTGEPAASLLLQAVNHTHPNLKMPPGPKLPQDEIDTLTQWIKNGAPWITKSPADFWSFQPLNPPAPNSTIDSLIRKSLAEKALKPNPRASSAALLRRLSFDLTGLPPTPEELQEPSIEHAVDRLLASPRFGERWARHWLDVARFGEDDFSGTEPKHYPNAWRYRDWTVTTLNRDMPYDLFLKAQIAGDLLPPTSHWKRDDYLGGLGLFGLGPWYFGISQPPQARADERHDRVDMVSRGMLGLTVACARCHDHKYDPISAKDYYALSGVFASVQYKEYPLAPAAEVEAYDAHQKKIKAAEKAIADFTESQTAQLASIFGRQIARYMIGSWRTGQGIAPGEGLDSELLGRWIEYLKKPDENHAYLDEWRGLASKTAGEKDLQKAAGAYQALILLTGEERQRIETENKESIARSNLNRKRGRHIVLPFGYQSEEDFNPGADVPGKSLPRDKYQAWAKLFQGNRALLRFEGAKLERFLGPEWKRHLDALRAEKKALEDTSPPAYGYYSGIEESEPWDLNLNVRGNPFELGEVVPRRFPSVLSKTPIPLQQGSGRLQLADAVTAHPLAARVMANRVWSYLLGAGIVRTPSNFGVAGDRPSNPELLEYLAWRFRDHGFSIKKLIREIALSETYQASSNASSANDKIDPANRYFWRANRRRLDAEALRDSMLAVAGTLDPAFGGDSKLLGADNRRRTIYARVGRYQQDPALALFDFPSASVTCERRVSTNVPLQKLFFLNSEFTRDQAKAFASRFKPSPEGIAAAYHIAFGRAPTTAETALGLEFIKDGTVEQYAQVLLSSNEFLFVD